MCSYHKICAYICMKLRFWEGIWCSLVGSLFHKKVSYWSHMIVGPTHYKKICIELTFWEEIQSSPFESLIHRKVSYALHLCIIPYMFHTIARSTTYHEKICKELIFHNGIWFSLFKRLFHFENFTFSWQGAYSIIIT